MPSRITASPPWFRWRSPSVKRRKPAIRWQRPKAQREPRAQISLQPSACLRLRKSMCWTARSCLYRPLRPTALSKTVDQALRSPHRLDVIGGTRQSGNRGAAGEALSRASGDPTTRRLNSAGRGHLQNLGSLRSDGAHLFRNINLARTEHFPVGRRPPMTSAARAANRHLHWLRRQAREAQDQLESRRARSRVTTSGARL